MARRHNLVPIRNLAQMTGAAAAAAGAVGPKATSGGTTSTVAAASTASVPGVAGCVGPVTWANSSGDGPAAGVGGWQGVARVTMVRSVAVRSTVSPPQKTSTMASPTVTRWACGWRRPGEKDLPRK